jgi:hypothetical protein
VRKRKSEHPNLSRYEHNTNAATLSVAPEIAFR